jgi:hypothetical protein
MSGHLFQRRGLTKMLFIILTQVGMGRLDFSASYRSHRADGMQSNVRGAHFLNEHPGFFDAQFFNLTHAEAAVSQAFAVF